MKVYRNGKIMELTDQEITELGAWERAHPTPAPATPMEERVADLELMLADLIGGAV